MKSRHSWLIARLIDVREFFWPMLEQDDDVENRQKISELKLHLADENLTKALELIRDVQSREDEEGKVLNQRHHSISARSVSAHQ